MSQFGRNSSDNRGGPEQGRLRRQGWPGYGGQTQPGNAGITQPPPPDSRNPILSPLDGRPFNPSSFQDWATAVAMGVQLAVGDPHVRMLIQQMLDNMARATFKPVVPPPWQAKPFRADYFGGTVQEDVPSSPSNWSVVTQTTPVPLSLQFTMPDGYMGVVRNFAYSLRDTDDYAYVAFRLVKNGAPIFPFNYMHCPISTPEQIQVIVMPGETVQLEVFNNKGSAVVGAVASMLGWRWPVAVAGDVLNAHGQASVA